MASANVLIDTSVIIDFLRKKKKKDSLLWKVRENNQCYLSVITLFELYAGATSDEKQADVGKIAAWITPVEIDAVIAANAAMYYRNLRVQNRILEFRDLFIAATAVHHHFQLATLNAKHFKRIKDLTLFVPA